MSSKDFAIFSVLQKKKKKNYKKKKAAINGKRTSVVPEIQENSARGEIDPTVQIKSNVSLPSELTCPCIKSFF